MNEIRKIIFDIKNNYVGFIYEILRINCINNK